MITMLLQALMRLPLSSSRAVSSALLPDGKSNCSVEVKRSDHSVQSRFFYRRVCFFERRTYSLRLRLE
jgi:hypothetical protein